MSKIVYRRRGGMLRPLPTGIQSVVFMKDQWTYPKALAYLAKHGFVYNKVDNNKSQFRFRQFEPSDRYNYTSRSKKGIVFIIADV